MTTRASRTWLALALAGLLGAAAVVGARASPAEFTGCDGYGAATAAGDGMTHYAMALGIFNFPGEGNTMRGTSEPREHGVADCDAALAELQPQHWLRRVSLLNARAAHHLEMGDTKSALADLDQAEAAATDPSEPYYLRSLALGTKFIRAYAVRTAGDSARGQAMALAAMNERPFEAQAALYALEAIGPGKDPPVIEQLLKADAANNPIHLGALFDYEFDHGRYDQALALCGQLVPPRQLKQPPDNGRARAEFDEQNRAIADTFLAFTGGECAYVLAIQGKAAAARAMIAVARDRLAKQTVDFPPADAPSDQYARMLRVNTNAKIKATASPALDSWSGMVDARLMVADGHAEDALLALRTIHPFRHRATVELLESIWDKDPNAATAVAPPIEQLKTYLAQQPQMILELDITNLWSHLPEVEAPERIPAYGAALTPLFGDPKNFRDQFTGYRELPGDAPGVTAIRYRGGGATMAIVGEMALLRAADLARRAGKTGFVIVDRRDVRFTLTTTQYGTPIRTDPQGFETELDVVFVDLAALPEPYAAAPWRVVDADAVYAALATIYRVGVPAKPR